MVRRGWCVLALFMIGLWGQASHAASKDCHTLARLHHQRNIHNFLSSNDALARPSETLFVDSSSYGLRVHYAQETQEELALELLGYLEEAWVRQVEGLNYPAPAIDDEAGGNDSFDLYLTSVSNGSALTVAEDLVETEAGVQQTSYILFDPSVSPEERALTIEHEFQHALQFATDPQASLFFFEASAVYMETLAFPQNLAYAEVIPEYQSWPNAPFFTDGIRWQAQVNESSFYEYGGVLFLMFLEETYGEADGALVAALWQMSKDNDAAENEPDFLDALAQRGINLTDALLDFATWRSLVNIYAQDSAGPVGGNLWSGDALMATQILTWAGLATPDVSLGTATGLYRGGCLPFVFTAGDEPTTLAVEMTSNDPEYEIQNSIGVSVAVFDRELTLTDRHPTRPEAVVWPFEIEATYRSTVLLVLCDAVGDWDADEEPKFLDVSLKIYDADRPPESKPAQNADETDAGIVSLPPEEEVPNECGCQTTLSHHGARGFSLLALSAVFLLLWNRRKSMPHE